MISTVRERYNQQFSKEKYLSFLSALENIYPGSLQFRLAETPVFIGKEFGKKILDACERIIDVIIKPDFKQKTERAIPLGERVPHESDYPQMLCLDFAVCQNEKGEFEPQLIEMQGFPTMYAFQAFFPDMLRKHMEIPSNFSHYFNGLNTDSYLKLFREIVVGDNNPEEVILLEVKPYEQKTLIDFLMTKDALGIELVCITELIAEKGNLFYKKDGRSIQIKKIYNRVIFDELHAQRSSLGEIVDLTQPYNVEWIPHPNWFYRFSKFTLPLIHHPFVPETHFLSDLKNLPEDLSRYVLKPLFSFAGQGVKIDLTNDDLNNIKDPSNYILQKKVKYADAIATPDGAAKTEIRMMYLWKPGEPRPIAVTNLARLSKGKMIGVRYNADKEWVGGTVAFFEQ